MELIIVIVVIGILATIAFIAYGSIQRRTIDSSMQIDAQNWYTVMSNSYAINGYYNLAATNSSSTYKTSGNNVYTSSTSGSGYTTVYTAIITNPSTSDAYIVSVGGAANNSVPQLVTNPYITSPLAGAAYDSNWCGPATSNNVYLSSSGGGTSTPTIQWQYLLPKNTTVGTWTNLPGATTARYNYFNSSGSLDYGDYQLFRVIYTNAGGTIQSTPLTVNITNGC